MRGSATSVAPFLTALLGAIVVLLLLSWPIRIGPGDHEANKSCGTAWSINVTQWRNTPDGDYYDQAWRSCSGKRADRTTQAVAAGSVILLAVAFLGMRARRRGKS